MTAQDMWTAYIARTPAASSCDYEAWAYGASADELAALTLAGMKRATSSAHPLYALEGEPLPQAGDHSVILNSQGEAVCVIRNVDVRIIPFHAVDARHAFLEGEGDRSLPFWQRVHEDFFRRELAAAGLAFTKDLAVVCEEFEVVYP